MGGLQLAARSEEPRVALPQALVAAATETLVAAEPQLLPAAGI